MRQRGSGAEGRARALRARVGVRESHREIESQRETGKDPVRARESQESLREQVRARGRLGSHLKNT